MTSRERTLAAINHQEPDRVPIFFRGVAPLDHLWRDEYERVDVLLKMGVDEKMTIKIEPGIHPDVRIRDWFEEGSDPRYRLACREYETPKGVLRAVMRCTEDCSYEDGVPLASDHNISRGVEFPVKGRDDLPKLAYLLREPDREDIARFREDARRKKEFAARRGILVEGYGGPSKDNRVELWLLGEDGRTLTKRYTWLYSYPGRPGKFFADIPFEIPLVAEMGWLQVRSYGERFGMLRHLTSVPLTLLSEGRSLIHPALRGGERIAIFLPREEAIVEGGRLPLRGAGWLETAGALSVEILDLHGKVIASGEVEVQSGGPGELGPFEAEIPYDIPYAQWARVGVGERLAGLPGWNHYSSVLVWLRP